MCLDDKENLSHFMTRSQGERHQMDATFTNTHLSFHQASRPLWIVFKLDLIIKTDAFLFYTIEIAIYLVSFFSLPLHSRGNWSKNLGNGNSARFFVCAKVQGYFFQMNTSQARYEDGGKKHGDLFWSRSVFFSYSDIFAKTLNSELCFLL